MVDLAVFWKPGGWPVGFRYYRELGFLAHGPAPSPSPNVYFWSSPSPLPQMCVFLVRRVPRFYPEGLCLVHSQEPGNGTPVGSTVFGHSRVSLSLAIRGPRWGKGPDFPASHAANRLASNHIRPLHRHQQQDTRSVSEAPSEGANTHHVIDPGCRRAQRMMAMRRTPKSGRSHA